METPFLKRSLREVLIEALSQRAPLSAEELRQYVNKYYKSCSIQALYKELRGLQGLGVVMRLGTRYSLHLSWVFQSQAFAESLHKTYLSRSYLDALLDQPDIKATWRVHDLSQADLIWTQLNLALRKRFGARISYCWINHPWFYLSHPIVEERFFKAFAKWKGVIRIVIGGNTFLDREYVRLFNRDNYRLRSYDGDFPIEREKNVEVIEDFTIVVLLERGTRAQIDSLFEQIGSREEALERSASLGTSLAARVKITLQRSARKANLYHKIFREFWGDKS